MGHHDVIVECAKLTLDPTERLREDTISLTSSFRSKSIGYDCPKFSSSSDTFSYSLQLSATSVPLYSSNTELDFFSPSYYYQQSDSPPATDVNLISSVPQTPVGTVSYFLT